MSKERQRFRDRTALGSEVQRMENELEQRRQRITAALSGIGSAARGSLVSPEALLTAGIFGFMLHRGQPRPNFALVSVLHMTSTAIRAWRELSAGR